MKSWLFLSVLAVLLAACSGPPEPTPSPPATAATLETSTTPSPAPLVRATNTALPTNTPIAGTATAPTANLILWQNLPPTQVDQLRADIAEFNQVYPNYQIQLQAYEDPDELAAAIVEGRVDFDLVLGPTGLVASLQAGNKIQTINNFFPASFLDSFASTTLTGASRQGQVWGLPDTAGFHLLLFFNRDLVEQPPATLAELTDIAAGLDARTPWGLAVNSQEPVWLLPWLWAYGGWITDGDGTPTLDTPAMVQALELYLSWHQGEQIIAPITSRAEAKALFTSGQAAMMIDGDWAIDELTQSEDIPWGVAVLPSISDAEQAPGPLVLGRYWTIGTDTSGPRAQAAIAFLEFVSQPERQLTWTEKFGTLPTRRDALVNSRLVADPALRVSAQQLQMGRGVPLNTDLNQILDAMRIPLEQTLAGTLSPSEAASQMQANLR